MAITPQTDLYLIKSTLELDNSNQLTFNSKEAQYDYFMSLPKIGVDNFTYQRKDNVIRYPEHIDNIIEYNYVIYRNEAYTDKIFYAYIDRMEYINDKMTLIYIKTDVFQTWQFDIEYKSSFVEREHVNNDSIGLHTVPEGLETGDYIQNGDPTDIDELKQLMIVTGVSDYAGLGDVQGAITNGVYSGLQYTAYNTKDAGVQMLNDTLKEYDQRSKADAVYTIFMAPQFLDPDFTSTTVAKVINYKPVRTLNKEITVNYSLNGYTPKNNKLLTGEYNYLLVSNNNGGANSYKYELFEKNTSGNINFQVQGVVTTGCSIRIIPINYNISGATASWNNSIEGLDLGKYSTCSWVSDSYTNWLTQNGVNNTTGLLAGAGSTLVGGVMIAASGGTLTPVASGLVAGGVGSIINTLGSIYTHSLTPDNAKGNLNNADVITASHNNTFTFYKMSIKAEYARIIDNFFSAYGYKVNTYKVPNITGRRNWNYVKTIGANIEGYLPQEDIQELKSMFNSGVTLWHNPSTFLDYSQNNAII